MTAEEEEALFDKRVKKINRDCLKAFSPYIVIVTSLIVGTIIFAYKEMRSDTKELLSMTASNKGELHSIIRIQEEHGKDIRIIQNKIFK